VYHLTHPELMDLLVAGEGLLAATGNAVALCPTYTAPAPATSGESGHHDEGTRDE
jgi:hypothetical protein